MKEIIEKEGEKKKTKKIFKSEREGEQVKD